MKLERLVKIIAKDYYIQQCQGFHPDYNLDYVALAYDTTGVEVFLLVHKWVERFHNKTADTQESCTPF